MIPELHEEGAIAWKWLTAADLGRGSSNQTHVGLRKDVLKFLPIGKDVTEYDSLLLCEEADGRITRQSRKLRINQIQRQDGSLECPKSNSGTDGHSITAGIRGFVSKGEANLDWYLVWFGIKDGTPVFFLWSSKSTTYAHLSALGVPLHVGKKPAGTLDKGDTSYQDVADYVIQILGRLQPGTGTAAPDHNNITPANKYNLPLVSELQAKIGRSGEVLIDRYLRSLRETGHIGEYGWANRETELGAPYDFWYKNTQEGVVHLDVKTTGSDFDEPIYFSDAEVRFAFDQKQQYRVFRVYRHLNEPALRICSDMTPAVSRLAAESQNFRNRVYSSRAGYVESVKFAVLPDSPLLTFGSAVSLVPFVQAGDLFPFTAAG